MTVGDLLAASAARWPANIALIEGGRRISYGDLDRLANRVANALRAAQCGRGSVLGVLAPNRLEYSALFFGAARAGVLQAHFSIRCAPPELAALLARVRPRLLFVDADVLGLARAALALMRRSGEEPEVPAVIALDAPAALEAGEISWDRFLHGAGGQAPGPRPRPEEEFCITFTGGTTGRPKGVTVTHLARTAVAEAAREPFEMGPGVISFLCTPLFHVAGLFSWHLTAISSGATLVLARKWDVDRFHAVARAEHARQALMVPTQVAAVAAHERFGLAALPELRLFNYGGSHFPVTALHQAMEKHPRLAMLEHYGQSEAGAICWRPPASTLSRPQSAGIPFSGISLAVCSLEGSRAEPGATGEILVHGRNLFSRYFDDATETAQAFDGQGWLRTGDIGYRDAEGYVFLVDRAKDMFISGGENIYPAEIENALASHPAVSECAVVGIPDAHWGEVPAAHIVLARGSSASEQQLIDHVVARIGRHKRPRVVRFVDTLPKTAIGKVQKRAIREPYWQTQRSTT